MGTYGRFRRALVLALDGRSLFVAGAVPFFLGTAHSLDRLLIPSRFAACVACQFVISSKVGPRWW